MIEFIVPKNISVMSFFLYSIQIQIDLNPLVHWGATTQTVNEKVDIKLSFVYLWDTSSHCRRKIDII